MDGGVAAAVVGLVKESITEGCASKADLSAAMAAQKADLDNAVAAQKTDLDNAVAAQKADLDNAVAAQKADLDNAMAAQKADLIAVMADRDAKVDARFDAMEERSDAMDKRLIVLEERSKTFVTKAEFTAALLEERRYTDAQFERVSHEIKDVGKSVTTLQEKMFGRTAKGIRIAATLAALIFIGLQVAMFFRM